MIESDLENNCRMIASFDHGTSAGNIDCQIAEDALSRCGGEPGELPPDVPRLELRRSPRRCLKLLKRLGGCLYAAVSHSRVRERLGSLPIPVKDRNKFRVRRPSDRRRMRHMNNCTSAYESDPEGLTRMFRHKSVQRGFIS